MFLDSSFEDRIVELHSYDKGILLEEGETPHILGEENAILYKDEILHFERYVLSCCGDEIVIVISSVEDDEDNVEPGTYVFKF